MRILIALALVVAGCAKKKEDPAPKTEAPKSAETKPKAPDPEPDEKPTPTEPAVQPAEGEPTKEMAENRLRDLFAALEAKDYKKAVTLMASSPSIPADKIEKELQRMLETKELSAHGIDALVAKGQWGKLETVAPGKGPRWAAKFDKPVAECWGLVFDSAEVGFHWDGKELKIIRLDDVGKLQ